MLLGIIAIAGLGALLWGCGNESPSVNSRRRQEHEDGGMPDAVSQARMRLDEDFNILIRGRKNGREGCATLQVHSPMWQMWANHQASLEQQIRWASFPPSSELSREIRLRSGDYRLEQITDDYASYSQLGLRYFLRASYNPQNNHLFISLQNVDLQTQNPSGIFLSPLYEGMNSCRANSNFSNEFFVANSSREVEISLSDSPRQVILCMPCAEGTERISFEIQ